MRPLALVTITLAASLLGGCQHGAYYTLTPLYPAEPAGGTLAAASGGSLAASETAHNRLEVLHDRLDGHWFERRIYRAGSSSTADSLELVYCPLVKDGPTVCRTSILWTRNSSALLGGEAAGPAR
ncbi:MAG TPA: hypothetical protein VIF09_14865 [Polyangiaceae bacterium]|jgi:hypothetical protein